MPPSSSIPGVTEFAFGRLLNPARDTPTLSLTSDGHLMVTVRGAAAAAAAVVRPTNKAAVAIRFQKLRFMS